MALPLCRFVQLGLPQGRGSGVRDPATKGVPARLLEKRKEGGQPAGKAEEGLSRWFVFCRLGRDLALIDLLVYRISHEVVADVDLDFVDARQLVDVVPDVLGYLEAKDCWAERACKVQVYIYLACIDIDLIHQFKFHYGNSNFRVDYLGQLVKDLSASLLQLLFLTHITIDLLRIPYLTIAEN